MQDSMFDLFTKSLKENKDISKQNDQPKIIDENTIQSLYRFYNYLKIRATISDVDCENCTVCKRLYRPRYKIDGNLPKHSIHHIYSEWMAIFNFEKISDLVKSEDIRNCHNCKSIIQTNYEIPDWFNNYIPLVNKTLEMCRNGDFFILVMYDQCFGWLFSHVR